MNQTPHTKPDYFSTKEECLESMKNKPNTNPRYKNFTQTHFTAGDEEQFHSYRDPTNGESEEVVLDVNENRFSEHNLTPDWEKYKDINAIAVTNTFNYMFEKFKKGIFIKIKNNKLAVFLPFSKKNFINEWSNYIKVHPKYGDMVGFMRYVYSLEGRPLNPKTINKFVDSWYSNNSLVRFEFPVNEGDTNHQQLRDMFLSLCEERDVPDIELFINRRDFPMIKKDGTEAYEDIFGKGKPLLSHNYTKYAPILSMVAKEGYADIPMPTGEDWARVSAKEGKFFPKSCRDYLDDFTPCPWSDKKPIAVFRGSSTGSGVTIDSNPRLKLAYLSKITPPDDDGLPLLDAGITSWNLRPRKLLNEQFLTTINIKNLPFGLIDPLSPQEQTKYKYIINVDGHVAAFRLSLELGMGSCILLADSEYKLWFREALQPYIHYVPVKNDLSDLITQIKWCKNHDAECQKIAQNAKEFHDTYLSKDGILDYLEKLVFDLKAYTGSYLYNEKTPFELQVEEEEKLLDCYFPTKDGFPETYGFPEKNGILSTFPNQARSYGMLQGIHWVINKLNKEGTFFKLAEKQRNVFQSRAAVTDEYTITGISIIGKTSLSPAKNKESIHETFVTTKCINELCRYIPNFVYNFGLCKNEKNSIVLMEYITGQTFSAYIQSPEFNLDDYLFILLQLSLALHMAQQRCALVHNDLTPWNIIIQKLPSPIEYDYIINYQTVYRVKTSLIPVIIDFGKAHVVYNDIHYGNINMYNVSTVQDILTVLATTIYEITEKTLPRETVGAMITLANFLSGTKYRKREFFASGKGGVGEIRYFFRNAKKYTHLVSDPKYELEDRTPLDLFNYVTKKFNKNFPVTKVSNLRLPLDKGNALQVFTYAFSSTSRLDASLNEEKIKSFTDIFSRIRKCKLPDTDNILFAHYILQSIKLNLESVYENLKGYLLENDLVNKYSKSYEKAVKRITDTYQHLNTPTDVIYKVEPFDTLIHAEYTADTFLDPKTVLKLLSVESPPPTDLSVYKDIIETILLQFDLSGDLKEYYIKNCFTLLHTNGLYMKNNTANFYTLRKTAKKVYSLDREKVLSTQLYDEILELVT